MHDEAPKAPVLLYAVEGKNTFDEAKDPIKFELMKINRGLWLGDLLPVVDMVIPFDSEYMQSKSFRHQPLIKEYLQNYKRDLMYHQSSFQSLVMHQLS